MKRYSKRLTSLWAAIMMLFNVVLPAGAFAADEDYALRAGVTPSDYVVLKNEVFIDGVRTDIYYFNDTLTSDDLAAIGGEDNIQLEYHLIDSAVEQYHGTKIYQDQDTGKLLGDAGTFHITAFDTATLHVHTNGNVLAQNLKAEVNFGTNAHGHSVAEASYVPGVYNPVNIGSPEDREDIIAIGVDNVVTRVDNGKSFAINGTKMDRPHVIYQDSANMKFLDINSVKAAAQAQRNQFAGYADANVEVARNGGQTTLTLTDPDVLGVINLTAREVQQLGTDVHFEGFQRGHDGTIIVNVDCDAANQIVQDGDGIHSQREIMLNGYI